LYGVMASARPTPSITLFVGYIELDDVCASR
jgi:hypothetical protein